MSFDMDALISLLFGIGLALIVWGWLVKPTLDAKDRRIAQLEATAAEQKTHGTGVTCNHACTAGRPQRIGTITAPDGSQIIYYGYQ